MLFSPQIVTMPCPGMQSPQWQKLSELYGCSFSDTFSRVMKMQYRLVLITAGASMPCAHLRELEVPHFDIRKFFPARNIREVDCRGKTAFSHSDVWDDFLGPEIFEARSFVLEALAEASGTTFWEPDGTTVVCVIFVQTWTSPLSGCCPTHWKFACMARMLCVRIELCNVRSSEEL